MNEILKENFSFIKDKITAANDIYDGILGEAAGALVYNMHESGNLRADIVIESISKIEDIRKKSEYCTHIVRHLKRYLIAGYISNELLDVSDKFEYLPESKKIAYFINPYSDISFKKFSRQIKNSTPVIAQSFSGVCEEVTYGRAGYCILPLSSSDGGMIGSFYKLIDKHDLKIAYTCDVVMGDDENTAKMALLRRGISKKIKDMSEADFFEISALFPDNIPFGEMISAMEMTGVSVMRINSIPLSYTDDKYSYNIVFNLNPKNNSAMEKNDILEALLMFLASAVTNYTSVGLYCNLQ